MTGLQPLYKMFHYSKYFDNLQEQTFFGSKKIVKFLTKFVRLFAYKNSIILSIIFQDPSFLPVWPTGRWRGTPSTLSSTSTLWPSTLLPPPSLSSPLDVLQPMKRNATAPNLSTSDLLAVAFLFLSLPIDEEGRNAIFIQLVIFSSTGKIWKLDCPSLPFHWWRGRTYVRRERMFFRTYVLRKRTYVLFLLLSFDKEQKNICSLKRNETNVCSFFATAKEKERMFEKNICSFFATAMRGTPRWRG